MKTKDIESFSQQFQQAAVSFQNASKVMSEHVFCIQRDSKELARSLSAWAAQLQAGEGVKQVNPPINTPT